MARLAAILDFAQNGHQGAVTFCLRWFLKTLYPYLTPCKMAKFVPDLHDCYTIWHFGSPLLTQFVVKWSVGVWWFNIQAVEEELEEAMSVILQLVCLTSFQVVSLSSLH